ncbi:hypothetical protein BO86DRAFT_20801 [Aspergillus japonicus CBS 114.51]|uniref:Uncharacterized protein n=1 Tax=Aspergillus japonicus CBS 114.51 TaxID=1448312 RepID=A0A8T8WKA4_ASPJA|nr:hypothetical protein BO86DRAFT_20801 [Aspergillus japonicus CBS 114.51]RAH76265.1 hypothetical protein BO86DRAFT_20801 [Aspergillus japonicus CBS 114.51]
MPYHRPFLWRIAFSVGVVIWIVGIVYLVVLVGGMMGCRRYVSASTRRRRRRRWLWWWHWLICELDGLHNMGMGLEVWARLSYRLVPGWLLSLRSPAMSYVGLKTRFP